MKSPLENSGSAPEHLNEGPLHNLPDGFPFEPDSHIRRLAEPATMLLFPYIAGMAIMDDRIAAAVDKHSAFTKQPWGRLFGSVDSAIVLVFGSDHEAVDTAERLYGFHKTIEGSDLGVHYNANDAEAQTWVLASVFQAVKEVKRRWAPPDLNEDQEEGLYHDVKTFGQFFGIDPSIQPRNTGELNDYWEDRIDSGDLLQTETSRKMAQTVFRFSNPKVPNSLARLSQAISVASLDSRLQDLANIHPSLYEKGLSATFDLSMRNTYARTPSNIRKSVIPAYMAIRRIVVGARTAD